jgi:beta-galactosidase beta subunit
MIYFKVMNYKVIDEVIDRIVVSSVLSNSNETARQIQDRKERERNYIALHLFLNNDELIWTENANNVNVDHNIQHDTDDFWDSDMFEHVDDNEDDDDVDEMVLVS